MIIQLFLKFINAIPVSVPLAIGNVVCSFESLNRLDLAKTATHVET